MESYKIVKFGIFDDFSHDFEKETITNVCALNTKELIVSTTGNLFIFDKKIVKKRFPIKFSAFTIVPDTDYLIGVTIKEGDLNIYHISDFLKNKQSNNSKNSPQCIEKFSTNQHGITHIFYSPKSNLIITVGSGIKVFNFKIKASDDQSDNPTISITKYSYFSPNYIAPPMTSPAFDKETELILLPTENGICTYSLSGAKLHRCSKNPSTAKTIYATYPTKPSKLAKLISIPSSNSIKRGHPEFTKEILTYDVNEGMNLWGNKGQLINHFDTIRSSVLSIIFIDSENAICINSCNILFYLNIKTGKTFYYMNLERSPSRLFLIYMKNEPILCACFGARIRALKLVIPWRVWNLNLEKTLSMKRCNKFMNAARILIDAESSFIKLISPRKGKILCSAKTNESYRPVSYFYDRGIFENYVFNSESSMYESKVIQINDQKKDGFDNRDTLFIVLQNGQILGFNPLKSTECEEALGVDFKASFMTFCRFKKQITNSEKQIENNDDFQWGYAVASEKGDLYIFDYFTLNEIDHFTINDDVLLQMFYDFDDNCIIMIFPQKTVLFDIEKGKVIDIIIVNGNRITAFFSNFLMYGYDTGHILRIGIENKKFVVYNNENKKINRDKGEIVMAKPHSCPITGFSFAQKIWISAGLDGNVIVWNYNFNIVFKVYLPLPLRSCLIMNGKCDILVATATEIMQIKSLHLLMYLKNEGKIDDEVDEIDNFDLIIDDLYRQLSNDNNEEESSDEEIDDIYLEYEKETNNRNKMNQYENDNELDDSDEFENPALNMQTTPISKLLPDSNSPASSSPNKQNDKSKTLNNKTTKDQVDESNNKADSQKVDAAKKKKEDGNDAAGNDKKAGSNNKSAAASSDKNKTKPTDKSSEKSADKGKNDNKSSDKSNAESADKSKGSKADKAKSDSADKDKAGSADKNKANSTNKAKSDSGDKSKTNTADKTKSDAKDKDSSKNADKSASKDKTSTKDKDSSKDKTSTKDKDSSKDKTSTKDKDSSKDKTSNKDKDSSKDKTSTKDKDSSKDKTSNKDKDSSKDKTSTKDKDSSKDKTSNKDKDNSKDKSTSKEKDSSKDKSNTKDKDSSKDKSTSKEKDSNKDKESTKDKDSSKDKINNKDKDSSKDKINNKDKDSTKDKSSDKSKTSSADKSKADSSSSEKSKENTSKKANTKAKENENEDESSENDKKINKSNSKAKLDKESSSKTKENEKSSSDSSKETTKSDNTSNDSKSNSNKINKSNSKTNDDSESENEIKNSSSTDNTNSKDDSTNKISSSNSKSNDDSKSDSNSKSNKISNSNSKSDDNSESNSKSDKKVSSSNSKELDNESIRRDDESNKTDESSKINQSDENETNSSNKNEEGTEFNDNNITNKDDEFNQNDEADSSNINNETNQNQDEIESNRIDQENKDNENEINQSNKDNDESNINNKDNELNQSNNNNNNDDNDENNKVNQSQNNQDNEIQQNDQDKQNEEDDETNKLDQNEDNKIDQENENNEIEQGTNDNQNEQDETNDNEIDKNDQSNENNQNELDQNDITNQETNENEINDGDDQINTENNQDQENNENIDDELHKDQEDENQNQEDGNLAEDEANHQHNEGDNENNDESNPEEGENGEENKEDNENTNKVTFELPFTGQYVRVPPPNVVIDKEELFELYESGRREFKPLVEEVEREEAILNNWHNSLNYVQNMTNSIASYEEYQKQKQSVKGFTLPPNKTTKHANSARAIRSDVNSKNNCFITANSKSISLDKTGDSTPTSKSRSTPGSPTTTSSNRSSLPRIKKLFYPASYVHNYNNNFDTDDAIATPRLFGRFSNIENMVEEVDADKNKSLSSSVLQSTAKEQIQLPPLLYSQPINADAKSNAVSSPVRSPAYNRTAPSPRRRLKQTQ